MLSELLTVAEIERCYAALKETNADVPAVTSVREKSRVLKVMSRLAQEEAEEDARRTPEHYIRMLVSSELTLARWKRLRLRLRDDAWRPRFVAQHGVVALSDVLGRYSLRLLSTTVLLLPLSPSLLLIPPPGHPQQARPRPPARAPRLP